MTNGTDDDFAPVADPTPDGDGGTRWPSWSDISRLHHIPSAPDAPGAGAASPEPSSTSNGPGVPEPRRPERTGPAVDEADVDDAVAAEGVPDADEDVTTADADADSIRSEADETERDEPEPETGPDETRAPDASADGDETSVDARHEADETDTPDDEPEAPATAAADAPAAPATRTAADESVVADVPRAADSPEEDVEAATDRSDAPDAVPTADAPRPAAAETAVLGVAAEGADRPARDAPAAAPAAPAPTAPTELIPPTAPSSTEPAAPPAAPERVSAFPATSAGASSSPHVDGGVIPVAAREASVLDEFEPDDGRRRWPRQLAIALGVVVLLAGAYAGASYALGHRVPRGATVAGVDIGGLTETAAVDRLTGRLGTATTGALTVKAGDQQSELDPTKAGLTFDASATVRRLVGVNLLQPVRLWNQVVGVGAQPAVTAVDPGALHTAVQQLADSFQVDPVNGTIVFADGTAHATPAQDGTDLDVPGAEKVIRDGWLVGARPLLLPTKTVAPDITQAETDAALTEVAQRVAGASVTVAVADRTAVLPASTLVANASFVAQDGKLVLQLNGPALVTQVLAQTPGLATAAADAHFEFQNDAPVLVPGTPGTTIDPAALASAVATAASSSNQRTATVQLVPSDPSQSTAALQALGIKEIVSEFATPLTSEPHRTVNITVGAAKLTGVLVKPGETFSLGAALSPMDTAHGYVDAGAIVDGWHVQALGGGLSQVSTTTFNAAYFAGFEDVAHTPHSEWFTRYPEGREATIFYPTLDMKWKNTSPYGALLQSWVADNQLHVRIWGTKYWTVTSTTSPRSNVHAPTTVYSQSPACTAQSAGNPGFTVTVTRQLALNGEVKQTTSRTTTYKAQDTIICGPAPSTASPSGP